MARPKKDINTPLSIEMQYIMDFPIMTQNHKKATKKCSKCSKIDTFNKSKPKNYSKIIDLNHLSTSFLQLHHAVNQLQTKNDKTIEMYTAIKNGKFIPLKTYISVINNLDSMDKVKRNVIETIEIFGKCPVCNVQFITNNELTFCPKCYLETTNINSKDTSSTNGIDKFKSTYLYKRVSHYINKLDKLTACENTKVPKEIINMIYDETRKEHRNIDDITIDRIKYYLGKYHQTKYADNVNQIYKIITGKQRVYIPPIIYNMLVENFTKIDQILSQLTEQEGNVNNFLNYSYLHYKICEHLNLKKYQYLFTLCKSQEKIYAHDAIWKTICKKIGWKFIPTI